MPRISVVLPTYNRADPLTRAIGSVLAQSFRDLELIVVDDGSTDDTAAIVAAIQDSRLRYVKQDVRGGVSSARNRGVELASAEWVAFQDSDDVWLPAKLERQLAAARADTALVVMRDRVLNDESLSYSPTAAKTAPITDISDEAAFRLPPAATWLVRRDALLAAGGFDPALNCYEDWELALRLLARGRILLLNEVLVERSRTAGSLFSDEASRLRNLQIIVTRHRETLTRHRGAWSYYSNALGQGEAQFGTMREARRWFLEALRAKPLSARSWANLIMSAAGPHIFSKYVSIARSMRSS